MYNFNTMFGPSDVASRAIPPNLLAPEFGEVSVRQIGDRLQVAATVAMGAFLLGDGEQCVTGLALDASQSMKDDYGRGKTIPAEISREFIAKGMYEEQIRDGVKRRVLTKEARQKAIADGSAVSTRNMVEKPSLEMIENLVRTFATGGATSGTCEVIYWACGPTGDEIESLGNIGCAKLGELRVEGPRSRVFGPQTHLTPSFLYFAEKAASINGIFVFVTDGHIEDESQVVAATHRLAAEIKAGRRPSLKCVLLGIGRQVDRQQLARIDDMQMPDELADIDIWNAKVLGEMRDLNDAWSEIFDPETVVGTSVRVFNDRGQLVHERTDEVKALITFEIPADSRSFELVLNGGEMKIYQSLV